LKPPRLSYHWFDFFYTAIQLAKAMEKLLFSFFAIMIHHCIAVEASEYCYRLHTLSVLLKNSIKRRDVPLT
jgi:hypothetical protein